LEIEAETRKAPSPAFPNHFALSAFLSRMKILLTGATGLVGGRLVPHLVRAGHQVIVLVRKAGSTSGPGVAYFQWNGKEIPAMVGPVDGVVNLAGAGIAERRWSDDYKRVIRQSRVDATQACVRFLKAHSPAAKVFVSASAAGYYGTERTTVLDESATPGRDFLAQTGVAWEAAAQGSGVPTAITRFGVILASEGGALPKLVTPFKLFAGGPIGTGKQGLPWIHIDDVVGLITFLLEAEGRHTGAFNAVAPALDTNASFAHTVGKVLHRPSHMPTPAFAIELLLGESAVLVTKGQLLAPTRTLAAGFTFRYTTAEAALTQLLAEPA
jgi:uncharacterized protein